jgi:hypothetical protein
VILRNEPKLGRIRDSHDYRSKDSVDFLHPI